MGRANEHLGFHVVQAGGRLDTEAEAVAVCVSPSGQEKRPT